MIYCCFKKQIDDISLLFVHMHHLLNEFRPHQARETLRVMMEMQKRQRIETASRFQKHLNKAKDIAKTALALLPDPAVHESNQKLSVKMDVDCRDPLSSVNSDLNNQLDRIMCKIIDSME